MSEETTTVYEYVGGAETFRRLVDEFYARVEADDVLRSMFPDDLEPGKHYQFLFLSQYFGGPTDYMSERGHPRLRMRHMPFAINEDAQQRWLEHMLVAIDVVGIAEPARTEMREYFQRGSAFMINTFAPDEQ
ncbi:MAG: globin [Chloroflexota bacterium]|nr:globin [Chloroflexota bacterium]